jgi:hypothetical protein
MRICSTRSEHILIFLWEKPVIFLHSAHFVVFLLNLYAFLMSEPIKQTI